MVLCPGGLINPQELPESLGRAAPEPAAKPSSPLDDELSDKQRLLQALEQTNYNRQAAARLLGIHKTTLYRRLRKLNIELPRRDGRNVALP